MVEFQTVCLSVRGCVYSYAATTYYYNQSVCASAAAESAVARRWEAEKKKGQKRPKINREMNGNQRRTLLQHGRVICSFKLRCETKSVNGEKNGKKNIVIQEQSLQVIVH